MEGICKVISFSTDCCSGLGSKMLIDMVSVPDIASVQPLTEKIPSFNSCMGDNYLVFNSIVITFV